MVQVTNRSSTNKITRRAALKAGAAGTVVGLAGCLGGVGGGTDTITVGALSPLSGALSSVGPNFQNSYELAVQHANEEYDTEVELDFSDSQSDPSESSSAAQEMINNGADFIVGSYSSAVAGALATVAERQGVIYAGIAGDNAITGEDCRPNTFISSTSATMHAAGGIGYAIDNDLGNSVYEISVNYAYGQSLQRWTEEQLAPNNDLEYLGNSFHEIGQQDLSGPIAQATDSGADIINLNTSDTTQVISQLAEFDVFDNHVVTASTIDWQHGQRIGQETISNDNFFAGSPYYWELDTPANGDYVDAYTSEFDTTPISYSPCHYVNIRTVVDAIVEAGSSDPEDLRPLLEDGEFVPQIWNIGERYRACDHRAVIGSLTLQGKDPSEVEGETDLFNVIRQVEDAEATMRTCEQTGCEF